MAVLKIYWSPVKSYERLCAICCEISICRMCFVGARYGHFPAMLSHISIEKFTPTPSLVFLVCSILRNTHTIEYNRTPVFKGNVRNAKCLKTLQKESNRLFGLADD